MFYALFNSFVKEDTILNLNPKNDTALIDKVERIMNEVFPTSESAISSKYEKNLLNIVWRVLGYTIDGKENVFDKVSSRNADFRRTLESIISNVVAGIIDNPNVPLKLSNPAALLNCLNMLQTQLADRTNNLVNKTARFWADSFDKLIGELLDDNDLMKALNINNTLGTTAETRATRLMRIGEKVGVSVPITTESFFVLADKLAEFLARVEKTAWDIDKAKELYNDPDNLFHSISHHWGQVMKKDFYAEAIAVRHT